MTVRCGFFIGRSRFGLALIWSLALVASAAAQPTFDDPFETGPAPRSAAEEPRPEIEPPPAAQPEGAAAPLETTRPSQPAAMDDDPFRDDPVQPTIPDRRTETEDDIERDATDAIERPSADQATVEAINKLLAGGKFAEAIPLLESASQQVPEEHQIWFALGIAYRMTEQFDKAIKALTEAAIYSPSPRGLSTALLHRGIVWFYKGELRIAVLEFEQAGSADNDDPRPEFWKGIVLAKQRKYRDAVTAYSNALRINSGYTQARNNRGLAYLALDEVDFAVADFDEVIRLEPDNASAYYKRGIALARRGDLPEAVDSYSDAIRLDEKLAAAYYNRGLLYRQLGAQAQADADLTKARQINPQIDGLARPTRLASR